MESLELFKKLTEKKKAELEKGAGNEDFKRVEDATGLAVPDNLKIILKEHNGEVWNFDGIFSNDFKLLGTEGIVREWEAWADLFDKGVVPEDWFNKKLLPFTTDESGNNHMIDMRDESRGQIIYLNHMDGQKVVANSLEEFLKTEIEEAG